MKHSKYAILLSVLCFLCLSTCASELTLKQTQPKAMEETRSIDAVLVAKCDGIYFTGDLTIKNISQSGIWVCSDMNHGKVKTFVEEDNKILIKCGVVALDDNVDYFAGVDIRYTFVAGNGDWTMPIRHSSIYCREKSEKEIIVEVDIEYYQEDISKDECAKRESDNSYSMNIYCQPDKLKKPLKYTNTSNIRLYP